MNEAKTEFSKAGLEEKLVVFFFFIKALAGKEAQYQRYGEEVEELLEKVGLEAGRPVNKRKFGASSFCKELIFEEGSYLRADLVGQLKEKAGSEPMVQKVAAPRQEWKMPVVEKKKDATPFASAKDNYIINKKKELQSGDFCGEIDDEVVLDNLKNVSEQISKQFGGGKLPPERKKFVPPLKNGNNGPNGTTNTNDPQLKNLDPKMVSLIESEIIDKSQRIAWSDIAGLDFAKKTIHEAIVWPLLRPDIFTGLRAPPKGLLLFGPPGTGKTMIGKAIASESKSTFFSISASSLTSKWVGDGEKMVRTLFALATYKQPSIIFIDEIDSLLCSRSEMDNEATRRLKTEFLVQMDGARSSTEDRILLIGATNRPQELDEAAKRRFQKRLYIPLPDSKSRRGFITNIIATEKSKGNSYNISESDIETIVNITKGYSCSDLQNMCAEASIMPLRNIHDITKVDQESIIPANLKDFEESLKYVKSTVSENDLGVYYNWNQQFGSYELKFEEYDQLSLYSN